MNEYQYEMTYRFKDDDPKWDRTETFSNDEPMTRDDAYDRAYRALGDETRTLYRVVNVQAFKVTKEKVNFAE